MNEELFSRRARHPDDVRHAPCSLSSVLRRNATGTERRFCSNHHPLRNQQAEAPKALAGDTKWKTTRTPRAFASSINTACSEVCIVPPRR